MKHPECPDHHTTRREFVAAAAAGAAALSARPTIAKEHEAPPDGVIDVHAHADFGSRSAWIPDWIQADPAALKRQQEQASIVLSLVSDTSLSTSHHSERRLLDHCRNDAKLRMWATYIPTPPGRGGAMRRRYDELLSGFLADETVVGAKVDLISGVLGKPGSEIVFRKFGEVPSLLFDIVRDGDPLFEMCATAKKPLLCHADLNDNAHNMARIVEKANAYPDVTVIVAHIGLGLNYLNFSPRAHYLELLGAQKAEHGNVYVDTSMFSLLWGGQIEDLAKNLGSERMLFGSDSPCKSAPGWIARIRDAEMDDSHKQNILHHNVRRLLHV